MTPWLRSRDARIALLALAGIACHLGLRLSGDATRQWATVPLLAVLIAGGLPLVARLIWRGLHGQFGADHLAGISIAASVLLHEYLAGTNPKNPHGSPRQVSLCSSRGLDPKPVIRMTRVSPRGHALVIRW